MSYHAPGFPPPFTYVCPICRLRGHWGAQCPNRPPPLRAVPLYPAPHPFLAPQFHMQGHMPLPQTPPQLPIGGASFYCESCDREFASESAFRSHEASHETCGHEGCAFRASRKALAVHFEVVHGKYRGNGLRAIDIEGQTFMVLMGTDPEEVRKWREARRKNYPTRNRLKEREDRERQREADGGLDPSSARRPRKRRRETAPSASSSLAMIAQDYGSESDDGEGTSDEEDGDEVEAASAVKNEKIKSCSFFFNHGKCRHGDDCKFSHETAPPLCKYFARGRRCPKGSRCNFWHKRSRDAAVDRTPSTHRTTLLKGLLTRDIRREASLVLQCLRYIRDEELIG